MTARERFDDALRSAGKFVDGKKALCPAHDDSNPSLSISDRRDGKGILINCHAGCDYRDVLAALGWSPRDLFDDDGIRGIYAPKRDYRYPDGRVVHRKPDKSFPQSDPEGNSLFHVDCIGDALTVYWPEGEKDVEAIEAAGGVAVCSAMGAGKAHLADVSPLHGKHVIVIADKDEPGRQHAQQVGKILAGVAESVRIMEAAVGNDFADHFGAGKGLDELVPIAVTDGAELLDDIEKFLARFVVYPSEHERRAHALWIAHTWLMDCWDSTPRIAFLSPEPGSGKSRALEVTEPLVPRPVHAVNTSPAYLFRKVSDPDGAPTILYDEIDTVFGANAKDNEDIRGMLNAGHRRGAVAGRCVVRGKIVETEELPAYCAVALAGLDDLPDTLMSRSVVSRMRRRAPSEPVEPWRHRVNAPEAAPLRQRLANWSQQVSEQAVDMWPEMPAGVEDRAADVWEALLAVADLAGDHWPDDARRSAVALVAASMGGGPSLGVLLLQDVRSVFNEHDCDRLITDQLLKSLNDLEEGPWATVKRDGKALDARALAQRVGRYGITSRNIRDGSGKVLKGYMREDFLDAWSRYLPDNPVGPPPIESATAATPLHASDGYGHKPICPGCGHYWPTLGRHRDDCNRATNLGH